MPHGRNLTWVSNVYESAPMPFSISRRVDVTTRNQAYSSDGCNIFPGLSYNKTNSTFLKSLRKNEVEAQVEFTLKIMERARVTCY